jgi:hypothetical protein
MKNKIVHYLLGSMCVLFGTTVFGKDLDKNNGYYFSGQGEFISIKQNFPETNYSLSLWFRTEKKSNGLLSIRDEDLGVSNDRNIWLSNNHIQHRLFYEEIIGSEQLNLADNQWHNLIVVVDELNGQFIYIDGQVVAHGNLGKSIFDWDKVLNLGYSGWGDKYFFTGWMKNVELYNNVLSKKDILEKFTGKISRNLQANLLGSWTLKNDLKDSTKYQNNGTLRFFKGNKHEYTDLIHGEYLLDTNRENISTEILKKLKNSRDLALQKITSNFVVDNNIDTNTKDLNKHKFSAKKYKNINLKNIKASVFTKKSNNNKSENNSNYLLETVGGNLFENYSENKFTSKKSQNNDFIYKDVSLGDEDYVILKKSFFQSMLSKFLAMK